MKRTGLVSKQYGPGSRPGRQNTYFSIFIVRAEHAHGTRPDLTDNYAPETVRSGRDRYTTGEILISQRQYFHP